MRDTSKTSQALVRLNAVCPYYTMYPLEFPLSVLSKRCSAKEWVLDPFCGRGTTNFAARLLGLPSVGIDSSAIAVSIAKAKLAGVTPRNVIGVAKGILKSGSHAQSCPE